MERVYKLVVIGTYNAQQYRNIFIVKWNDPTGLNTPNALIGQYLTSMYDAGTFRTHLSNLLQITAYERYYRDGGHWIEDGVYAFSKPGTSTQEALPGTCCGVILGKSTNWRGFGRKFFSGILEADEANGTLGTNILTLLTTVCGYYIATLTDGATSLTPGIYHLATEAFHAFATGVVDTLVGSQRRRKPTVGA